MPKKSGGMQKSYVRVVFHPYQKPNQNPHFNSLCIYVDFLEQENRSLFH